VKRVWRPALFLFGLIALLPLPAAAASTAALSPSLDQVLLAQPAGYAKVATAALHGKFTAADYTKPYAEQAVQAEHVLTGAGFVDGYGLTWTQKTTRRTLVEFVIAFTGGAGARQWLDYEQTRAKSRTTYRRADPLPGVDPFYGTHLVSGSTITDAFAFVKGNDVISVSMSSARDDKLALVTQQTMNQYYFAPVSTIPSDQWPENAKHGTPTPSFTAPNLSRVTPFLLAALALVGIIAVAAGVFMRWKRWKKAPASVALQMSPDGSHWWDGHSWRDSAREAPPFAQRSGDGGFWWDGHTWRPVPQAAAVSSPITN
jgi:hypothetical protein